MEVTVGLAFLAGLASFLSPCVFSLVPVYVGYLSGRAVATAQSNSVADRWVTFSHGLAFVLGFSVVFITLGVAVFCFRWFTLRLAYLDCKNRRYPGHDFWFAHDGVITYPFPGVRPAPALL